MDISWMLGILIILAVACIVLWGARKLMAAWGLEEPIATTVYVVLVIIFAVMILLRIVPGAVHL